MEMEAKGDMGANSDVDLDDLEILVKREGLTLVIDFSDKLGQELAKSQSKYVIVKLLGQRIGYRALAAKLQLLWQFDNLKILDLGNDYFLIKFSFLAGIHQAGLEGPWIINGSYLLVQLWYLSFDVVSDDIHMAVAWMRLLGLLVHLQC